MKNQLIVLFITLLTSTPLIVVAQENASLQGIRVECLGVEHDGSQTLRVQGTGRNRADALEQAKKNAVVAVLFNGVRGGLEGCDKRPLLSEANAREKYSLYFDIFFMDRGEYTKFVSLEDERPHSRKKKDGKVQKTYIMTIRVLRSQLADLLRNDGILTPNKNDIENTIK